MATATNNHIAEAIYLATKDKQGDELSQAVKEAVQFLARKRLFPKSKNILLCLEKLIHQASGVVVVKVISAKPASEETRREITDLVKKRYSAKEVKLEEKIDERLIGGMRIEVNDEVIDASFKNKIDTLQAYLTNN